ncbi:MAG: thioredoxin-related protein [Bacteroidota bacterium]|jgi:thioredoxin-related protein|nr:thioredoxin-related protein [Bacteroidota bacterium]
MAGIILLAVAFYTCKKSTIQASINSPENRVSNFIKSDQATYELVSANTYTQLDERSLVNWVTFDEAYRLCKKNPRPIMVDIYTTWCGPCKLMRTQTFGNPQIAEYINSNFYAVKLDAESKDSVKFDSYVFVSTDASNPKAPHQFAASILDNQLAYPSIVFLNNQIQRLDILKGFMPPKSFEPILNYYGSGEYQKTKWEEYQKTFVSRLN